MRLSKGEKTALAVGGSFIGGVLLYYLVTGTRSDKNAVLIPDAIEDRLDVVVEALDRQFNRLWVDRGISVLKSVLSKTLPASVVALVDVVVAAEKAGQQQGWRGYQKRAHAVRLANA